MLFKKIRCKVFTRQQQTAQIQHEKSLVREQFHKQDYNELQVVYEFTLQSSIGKKPKQYTQGKARTTR